MILSLDASDKIELLAADKLVTLIEDVNFLNNQGEINFYLNDILSNYNLDEFSHIILGCTHFPLVKENINKILKQQNKDIKVIDGNEGIGRNLLNKIEKRNDKENVLNIHIISTKESETFMKRVKEIL